ncbi:MAG TPA: hypothetical protein VMV94_04310 [Phycisphaerae bacterium]|nr:hypothetical protein [Phycisphaerae bacterium]
MNIKTSTAVRLVSAGIALALLSGCVRVTDDGDRQVIDYELWVPLVLLLGCLVAIPAGWFLRDTSQRIGWGLMILGVLFLITGVPSIWRDRVTIDAQKFTVRTGFWGVTSVHAVDFDDVQLMRLIVEEKTDSRGRSRTNEYLACQKKSGGIAKVPMSNEMCQTALPYILKAAEQRGISVSDER